MLLTQNLRGFEMTILSNLDLTRRVKWSAA